MSKLVTIEYGGMLNIELPETIKKDLLRACGGNQFRSIDEEISFVVDHPNDIEEILNSLDDNQIRAVSYTKENMIYCVAFILRKCDTEVETHIKNIVK